MAQAAYLHDVGGILQGRRVTLTDVEEVSRYVARIGADLLDGFPQFASIAMIVRHCQTPYRETKRLRLPALDLSGIEKLLPKRLEPFAGRLSEVRPANPMALADLIHLADSVSLMIRPDEPVLNQVPEIMKAVREGEGDRYAPDAVRALEALEDRERIWFDLAYNPDRILEEVLQEQIVGIETTMQMAKLISMIIDFRSPFTAMHSAGVAVSARELARLCGMNALECDMMEIAGNLHDLGKIRTPAEILEKPGKLTDEEFNVVKEHAYFSDVLLSRVRGFEVIGKWAALHHEKLNGKGYPYHMKDDEIPIGAKIMAVADVFSAITEDRPYRKGMPGEKVRAILRENAGRGELSAGLVDLLIENYDKVNVAREKASHEAGRRYYRSMEKVEDG